MKGTDSVRTPPLPPATLDPDLRALHDDMAAGIDQHLHGFVSSRSDGALLGPFAPLLHYPQYGRAAWSFVKSLMENSALPRPAHEVAILVVGGQLHSRYELYSHERVATGAGLAPDKIATIAAGERPADLDDAESAAYDVAAVLVRGGQLPESTYQRALEVFGEDQVAELVFLIGGYCLVSVLLNAFDVAVPGDEEELEA